MGGGRLDAKILAKHIFKLINSERARRRLPQLQPDEQLIKIAIDNAMNRKNCTVHYAFKNERHFVVAKRIVKELMKDPNHKRQILNKSYTHVGLGICVLWNESLKEYEIYLCKRFKSDKRNRYHKKSKTKPKSFNFNIRKIILKNKKTFEYFLVAVMLYIALYIAFLVKS